MSLNSFIRSLVRPSYYLLRYALSRQIAILKLGGITAKFRVDNKAEYMRVAGLRGEKAVLRDVLNLIRPGDVIFDVGANVGTHAILFARKTGPEGKVIAFEPEPGVAARLVENVQLNGLNNVALESPALGAADGETVLYVDRRDGSGQHRLKAKEGWSKQVIQIMTGDGLIERGDAPFPDVIKIDVEGAELDVLIGLDTTLRSDRCRMVVCEAHNPELSERGSTREDVIALLREMGYSDIDIRPRGTESHLIARKQHLVTISKSSCVVDAETTIRRMRGGRGQGN